MTRTTQAWIWAGIDRPIRSRSEARRVRDSTDRALTLIRAAIAKHGPVPGYARTEADLERLLLLARQYLGETRVCGAGGCR